MQQFDQKTHKHMPHGHGHSLDVSTAYNQELSTPHKAWTVIVQVLYISWSNILEVLIGYSTCNIRKEHNLYVNCLFGYLVFLLLDIKLHHPFSPSYWKLIPLWEFTI